MRTNVEMTHFQEKKYCITQWKVEWKEECVYILEAWKTLGKGDERRLDKKARAAGEKMSGGSVLGDRNVG